MNDIAKNIKKLRQRKSLTQEELAEKLFVTRQAVSNWETGKNQPDLGTLKSLAETLEVDIKDVIYGGPLDEVRRRKIATAVILAILTATAWVAVALLYEKAKIERSQFKIGTSMFLLCVMRPAAFLLLGITLPALISIWREVHPATARIRLWMLVGGIGILAVYVLIYLLSFYFRIPTKAYYYLNFWAGDNPWLFIIPGVLLFCGSRRKAG